MKFTQAFILFLAGVVAATIFACELDDSEFMNCAADVDQFCKVELFPYTIQSIYDSRDCLRMHRDFISKQCLDYLRLDKPSIVESCFIEMKTSCSNVLPGCFNLYSCLSGISLEDLSQDCKETLLNDEEVIGNEANVLPAYRIGLWNNWTKSLEEITKSLLDYFNKIPQGSYLRGSIYIEIMGKGEEGTVYLSLDSHEADDGNNDEPDSTTVNDLNPAN